MSAGQRTKGVVRHTLIYGLGTLLSRAVSFFMLPVYTRLLTPADYGTLALIEMTLDVISIGAGAQLAHAIFRFYHKADSEAEKNTVVSTVFFSLMLSYGLIAAGTAYLAPELSQLIFKAADRAPLIRIASGGLASQCLLIVPFALLQVRERSQTIVVMNLVKLVLQLSLNILFLVGMGMGVRGILTSTIVANTVVGVGVSIWTVRTVGISYSADTLRTLIRYAVPMIGMQFATFFTTFGDRYFLKAYGDEASVGLYNLAYQFGFLLYALGFGPFMSTWGPRRFAIAKSADLVVRDRDLSAGFGYANLVLLSAATMVGLVVEDVLRLMTTPAFYAAAAMVPVIVLAYVFQCWASILDLGILVRERTEYLALGNWISFAVALLGWVVLIPRFGAMGAACVAAASLFTRFATTYYFAQRLWRVEYAWATNLCMAALGIMLVVVARLLPALPWVPSVALHGTMFLAYLAYCWRFGPLTDEEKHTAVEMARARVAGIRAALAR